MLIETSAEDAVFHPHQQLHPRFWAGPDALQPGLREKLLAIVQYYLNFLKLPAATKLRDITFTGSLAGYNYTDYSDVDLHVILDYGQLSADADFVANYFKALKDLWSEEHEVSVFGFPVELFAQDAQQYAHGPGAQYSLVRQQWVRKPEPSPAQLDRQAVLRKARELRDRIHELQDEEPSPELLEEIQALWKRLKNLRQTGLSGEGEYSIENLAFKVLRNTGELEKLTALTSRVEAALLSVTEQQQPPAA